ncbi:polysaccharide deacetylase family protein [Agromyces larvae]|uniref:Polysaccharide deacetylase family protein n=1 Tax=Agromyces larvae TaxID=2929802 RepID=A0ABY4BWS2_9MICO|nr:polysaccharide deacetylase family protein [Agromyces larvae]UOE43199.1 polysaccharide deacetylase family protein [Agromyces larvae]
MGWARRRRVSGVGFVAVLAAASLLAGCAPAAVDDALWSVGRPPRIGVGVPVEPQPVEPWFDGEDRLGRSPQPRVATGRAIPQFDPEEAPGLVSRLAAMAGADFTAVARWATPPGRTGFGDRLDGFVAGAVREYASSRGAGWTPGVDIAPGGVGPACARTGPPSGAHAFSIGCTVVAASGPMLGERIVVLRREAGVTVSATRAVQYRAPDGALGDGADLYRPETHRQVLGQLARALVLGNLLPPGAAPFRDVTAEGARAILADSTVVAEGVVIAVPWPVRADGSGEYTVTVVLPARTVGPWLTGFGRSILDAVRAAEPFDAGDAPTAADPVDCTLVACVSITYDDGPTGLTDTLLDTLADRRAPATFFLQGGYVGNRPDTVRRTAAEGHELGNHTWGHPDLTKLPDDQVRAEIDRTQAAIAAVTGQAPAMVRPPYGASDERVRSLVPLVWVVWSVDTNDWRDPGVESLTAYAVGAAGRGGIILMHDTHAQTVEAAAGIVDGLRARGFTLATVGSQFGGVLPPPGTLVSHGQ